MPVPEPDAGWVERLRARNPEAVREFLDGFGPSLLAFLARFVGPGGDAEGLAVFQGHGSYDDIVPVDNSIHDTVNALRITYLGELGWELHQSSVSL